VEWFCAERLSYQNGYAYLDGERLLKPLQFIND
jgi:hypothetical protein